MVCLSCTGTGERVCLSAEGFGNRHCFLEGIADRVSLMLRLDPTTYLNFCIKYKSKGPSIKDVANREESKYCRKNNFHWEKHTTEF